MSSNKPTTLSLADLLNDTIVLCFQFVGPRRYRFVAGTCRLFRKLYLKVEPAKRTSWQHAIASLSCAQFCLDDNLILARMERQAVLERLAMLAAALGRLELVQWAHGLGLDLTTTRHENVRIVDIATYGAHMPTIEYLSEAGCEFTGEHCVMAIHSGNLPMLRHMHENGSPWDAYIFNYAASVGNLEIIKYLEENRCGKNEAGVVEHATHNGHLEVLQYLFDKVGWDLAIHSSHCCLAATREGSLEILRYVNQKGMMLDPVNVCILASGLGQLEVLRYTVENFSSEWNEDLQGLCRHCAAHSGHDHVVQWIRNNH